MGMYIKKVISPSKTGDFFFHVTCETHFGMYQTFVSASFSYAYTGYPLTAPSLWIVLWVHKIPTMHNDCEVIW